MATRYIVPGAAGDGTSPETPAPWATVLPVVAGNTYLQLRGTTEFRATAISFAVAASAEAPIVIGAYGTGAPPVIRGQVESPPTAIVQLAGAQYVTLEDIAISDNSTSSTTALIVATGSAATAITLRRLTLARSGRHGIQAVGGVDWIIEDIDGGDFQRSLANLSGMTSPRIRQVEIDGWNLEDGSNVDMVFIHTGSTDVEVSDIESLAGGGTTAENSGAVVDISGTNGACDGRVRNVSGKNSTGPIVVSNDSTVDYEAISGTECSQVVIFKGGGTYTVRQCGGRAFGAPFKLGNSTTDFTGTVTVRNCAWVRENSGLVFDAAHAVGATLDLDHSAYHCEVEAARLNLTATEYTEADWFSTTGHDEHAVWADPLFRDAASGDFRLRPTSPALGAGTDWWTPEGLPVPRDAAGNRYLLPPSLGAYELRPDLRDSGPAGAVPMRSLPFGSDGFGARRLR